MSTQNLILRFYDWQCGHHQTCPDDIAVSSSEQATAILKAMSHCISQPGHFHVWLMDDKYAIDAYVTDDYVSIGSADKSSFPNWSELDWSNERPVLIFGTDAQIAELNHPDNAEAVSSLWLYDTLPKWDASEFLDQEIATTTLTQDELHEITLPHEWHEPSKPSLFGLPPVFKTAESALEEVRQERASIAACADDTGIFGTESIADMDRAHGKVALRQVFDEMSVQAPVPPASDDQGAA